MTDRNHPDDHIDSETSIPGEKHYEQLTRETMSVVLKMQMLSNRLKENEELLVRIGQLLNIAQPPMDGKIGIRFWVTRTAGKRAPLFVQWHKSKINNRFYPKALNGFVIQKLRSYGAFAVNHSEARELVTFANQLLDQRKKILSLFDDIERKVKPAYQVIEPILDFQNKRLPVLEETIRDNLNNWDEIKAEVIGQERYDRKKKKKEQAKRQEMLTEAMFNPEVEYPTQDQMPRRRR